MPLLLTKREDPLFPLKGCCCMDNRMGTFFGSIFVFVTSLLSLIFISLDQYAVDNPSKFQISGAFNTNWRTLQYASWKACNVILICCYIIAIIVSALVWQSIVRRKRIYDLRGVLVPFNIWMWMYMIIELGIICFEYSWYTWHVFRLPWTCFIFVFWFLRLIVYILVVLVSMSYASEIDIELGAGMEAEEDAMTPQTAGLFQPSMPTYSSEPQIGGNYNYPSQQRMYTSNKQPYGMPPGFTAAPPVGGSGYFAGPPQPPAGQPYTMQHGMAPPTPGGWQQPPAQGWQQPPGPGSWQQPPAQGWQQPPAPTGWQQPPVGSMQSIPSAGGVPSTSFGGMQVNPNTVEDDF